MSYIDTTFHPCGRSSCNKIERKQCSRNINLNENSSTEIKLSQYADDTCLFLKDEGQIPKVLQVIEDFSELAGPKLNRSKTEGLWLGKNTTRQAGCRIRNIK